MGTRGAIARPNGDGFLGRYHHWDSYPEGLGATLFWLAQPNSIRREMANLPPSLFDGDIEAMLKVLIDDHPAGWSTINGADWSLAPGFGDLNTVSCTTCGKAAWEHYRQYYANQAYSHNKTAYDGSKRRPPKGKADPTNDVFVLGHAPTRDDNAPKAPECYCHGSRSEDGWLVDEHNAAGSGVEYVYVIDAPSRTMTVLSSYSGDEKMVGMFGMGDPDSVWKPIGYVNLDGNEPSWARMGEEEEVPA